MKRRRLLVSAFSATAIATGLLLWQRATVKHDGEPVGGTVQESPAMPEEQKPVGWVFGRLMGFPGAEKPLTSTAGPAKRLPVAPAQHQTAIRP